MGQKSPLLGCRGSKANSLKSISIAGIVFYKNLIPRGLISHRSQLFTPLTLITIVISDCRCCTCIRLGSGRCVPFGKTF
jgi:hypothetical protein